MAASTVFPGTTIAQLSRGLLTVTDALYLILLFDGRFSGGLGTDTDFPECKQSFPEFHVFLRSSKIFVAVFQAGSRGVVRASSASVDGFARSSTFEGLTSIQFLWILARLSQGAVDSTNADEFAVDVPSMNTGKLAELELY